MPPDASAHLLEEGGRAADVAERRGGRSAATFARAEEAGVTASLFAKFARKIKLFSQWQKMAVHFAKLRSP